MSIVIAVLAVLIVGTFIANYHPIFKLKPAKEEKPTPVVTELPKPTSNEEVVEAVKKIKKADTTAAKPKKPKTQVTKKQIKNG
jgi:cell division protein FtsN